MIRQKEKSGYIAELMTDSANTTKSFGAKTACKVVLPDEWIKKMWCIYIYIYSHKKE